MLISFENNHINASLSSTKLSNYLFFITHSLSLTAVFPKKHHWGNRYLHKKGKKKKKKKSLLSDLLLISSLFFFLPFFFCLSNADKAKTLQSAWLITLNRWVCDFIFWKQPIGILLANLLLVIFFTKIHNLNISKIKTTRVFIW